MNNPVDQQCFLDWDGSIDPALSSIGEISSFHSLYAPNLSTNGIIPTPQPQIPTSCFDQLCNESGFVETAAPFSSFDGRNYNGFCENIRLMGLPGNGASVNLMNKGQIMPQPAVSDNGFGSTVSDPSASVGTSKKRKPTPKGKGRDNSKVNKLMYPIMKPTVTLVGYQFRADKGLYQISVFLGSYVTSYQEHSDLVLSFPKITNVDMYNG
jgi:hypothetical protein